MITPGTQRTSRRVQGFDKGLKMIGREAVTFSSVPDAPPTAQLRWFVLRVPLSGRQYCGSPEFDICPWNTATTNLSASRNHDRDLSRLVSSTRRSNLRTSARARARANEKLIGVGVPRYFCRLITPTEGALINFVARRRGVSVWPTYRGQNANASVRPNCKED